MKTHMQKLPNHPNKLIAYQTRVCAGFSNERNVFTTTDWDKVTCLKCLAASGGVLMKTDFRHTARDEKGRYTHEFFWIPATEDYGLRPADLKDADEGTEFASGSLCYGCGKWDGVTLKRGEVSRFLKAVAESTANHTSTDDLGDHGHGNGLASGCLKCFPPPPPVWDGGLDLSYQAINRAYYAEKCHCNFTPTPDHRRRASLLDRAFTAWVALGRPGAV